MSQAHTLNISLICTQTRVFTCTRIEAQHISLWLLMCICLPVCLDVSTYVCIYASMHGWLAGWLDLWIDGWMYVLCTYVYMQVCTCAHRYVGVNEINIRAAVFLSLRLSQSLPRIAAAVVLCIVPTSQDFRWHHLQ